jgi:hypothetical protein
MAEQENPWTILSDDSIERSILTPIDDGDDSETEKKKTTKEEQESGNDDDADTSSGSEYATDEESETSEGSEESTSGDSDDDNPIEYLAKEFSEKGLISIPEGMEIKSEEDLDKAIEYTIQEGIQAYKEQFDPETRSLINFLEMGGTIEDYVNGATTPAVEDYDLSTEDNQKMMYRAYLEATINISDPEKKARKIEHLIDEAELEDSLASEAEEAKNFFIEQRQLEQQALIEEQKERARQEEEQRQHVQQTVVNLIHTLDEVNELPLGSKKDRQELEDYIFKPTVNHTVEDSTGKKRTIKISKYQADKIKYGNSEEARMQMFLFDAVALKKGYKFDDIKKKGVTEHNKTLQQKAAEYRKKKEAELKGHKHEPGSKDTKGYTILEPN